MQRRAGRHLLWARVGVGVFGILVSFARTGSLLAQTRSSPTRTRQQSAAGASSLPKSCLAEKQASEKVRELLETIEEHPTAGAYNTLGALYATEKRLDCAIPSFEASIGLDHKNWEAHYNLALALISKGDQPRAAAELRAAIHEKPDSATSHFALGTLLLAERKPGPSAAEFNTVLAIDPTFPLAAINLARAMLDQENAPGAISVLEKALSQPPPSEQVVPITVALGLAYAQGGRPERAIETLEKLVADHADSADAHFGLGTLYSRATPPNWDRAVAEFRETLRLDPQDDQARLSLGHALVSNEKFADALPFLRQYIEREPRDYQGYYVAGLAYKGLRQWAPAAELLERAARLNARNYEVHYDFGSVLTAMGNIDRAIEQFQAAEKISPTDADLHDELARLLEEKGQKELAKKEHARAAALESRASQRADAAQLNAQASESLASGNARGAADAYRKALDLDPENPQLHYNLSLALDKIGDQVAERQELEKAVQLKPDLAVAHNQLGILALQRGRQPEAEDEFKKALASDPEYAEAQNNLAVLYNRQGKDSQAAALYQQAIESDPKYTKAYVNLGLLMAKHDQVAQGEEQLRKAIQLDPNYPGAYTALGMIQGTTGRGREAVESFRKAVALDPGSAETHLNLGIALVDQYNRTAGFKEFEEAARLDPESPRVHYNLGRFYFESAKYDEARRELNETIRLQPDHALALYFLALAAKQDNDLGASTKLFQKVVALEPHNPDAQFLLGQNLEHEGKAGEAVAHWKLALEADPNYSQALYNLARALRKSNDPEAEKYQERYEALQKAQQVTDRVEQLGNFALEASNAQNWPQAFEQMAEAIELCGSCPEAEHLHKNLGLMYVRTGKYEEAEKELETALGLNPDDGDAKQALTAIQKALSAQGR